MEGGLVGGEGHTLTSSGRSRQGGVEIGEGGAAGEDAIGRPGHDRLRIGAQTAGRLDPRLAALEEGDQAVQLAAIREAILLLRLTDAGERQGVVPLRTDPGAAAAGGHGHGSGASRASARYGCPQGPPGGHEQMFAALLGPGGRVRRGRGMLPEGYRRPPCRS